MKAIRIPLLAACVLALSVAAGAAEIPELNAFPAPGDGMVRFVIVLPPKERADEDDFKVELVAGKEMMTDGVNLVRLSGAIEPRNLEGWGYTYYELTGADKAISTLMAPPEGAPQVRRFVSAAPLLIRYNSRLPVVVYAPAGYQVRYRIWTAAPESMAAEPS